MSDYQPKPGSFTLFKNERREKETHPEYRGDGALPDGTPAEIAAWVRTSSRGTKFFSISIKPKESFRPAAGGGGSPDMAGGRGFAADADLEDSIPFATSNSIF